MRGEQRLGGSRGPLTRHGDVGGGGALQAQRQQLVAQPCRSILSSIAAGWQGLQAAQQGGRCARGEQGQAGSKR